MSIAEDFGGSPADLPRHAISEQVSYYVAENARLKEDNMRLRKVLSEIAQRARLASQ